MVKTNNWYGDDIHHADLDQNFYIVGGVKMVVSPKLPKTKNLFGNVMSVFSRNLLAEEHDNNFRFKRNHNYHMGNKYYDSHFYNYQVDNKYQSIHRHLMRTKRDNYMSNADFLYMLRASKMVLLPNFITDLSFFGRGPNIAPEPNERDTIGYVWPSFIIWGNETSYVTFDGSPDLMEFPKDVLRETRGHPCQDRISPSYRRPRFQTEWSR